MSIDCHGSALMGREKSAGSGPADFSFTLWVAMFFMRPHPSSLLSTLVGEAHRLQTEICGGVGQLLGLQNV